MDTCWVSFLIRHLQAGFKYLNSLIADLFVYSLLYFPLLVLLHVLETPSVVEYVGRNVYCNVCALALILVNPRAHGRHKQNRSQNVALLVVKNSSRYLYFQEHLITGFTFYHQFVIFCVILISLDRWNFTFIWLSTKGVLIKRMLPPVRTKCNNLYLTIVGTPGKGGYVSW